MSRAEHYEGRRDTQFGHKLNLTTGKHGMVLDVVIEDGNPADSSRLLPMIKRIKECYGKLPRQVAALAYNFKLFARLSRQAV